LQESNIDRERHSNPHCRNAQCLPLVIEQTSYFLISRRFLIFIIIIIIIFLFSKTNASMA
jgi:hypothetical protein